MDVDTNSKDLPKDLRWQDLILKFKCPQCQIYQGSTLLNLEKHIILHCKCRPLLIRNHYIRKLKQLSSEGDGDVLDYVRLTLEAKCLQWTKEGMPEIPAHFKQQQNTHPHSKANSFVQSRLLDLWRLWHQEVDSLDANPKDILHLMSEAESSELGACEVDVSMKQEEDLQLNLELMQDVAMQLKEMQSQGFQACFNSGEDIELAAIERLEREASAAAISY